MTKPALPVLLALASLLAACSRGDGDAQVKERAHAFLLQRCQATGLMIPGAKRSQLDVLCGCSADRGVAAIAVPDLRTLLKDREFGRDAERTMHGIRNDCMKLSGVN